MTDGLDHAVIKQSAIAYWQRGPLNRPGKVTSVSRSPMFWADGYITCHKFIAGRTLLEAERILGLRPGELASGAYLYELLRLPLPEEFDTRGYTQTPGGQPWHANGLYPAGRWSRTKGSPQEHIHPHSPHRGHSTRPSHSLSWTRRPNPSLTRSPQARGFATVPGSRLASFR